MLKDEVVSLRAISKPTLSHKNRHPKMVVVAAVLDTDVIGIDNVVSFMMIRNSVLAIWSPLPLSPLFSPPKPLTFFPHPHMEKLRAGTVRQGYLIACYSQPRQRAHHLKSSSYAHPPPPECVSCQRSLEQCQSLSKHPSKLGSKHKAQGK